MQRVCAISTGENNESHEHTRTLSISGGIGVPNMSRGGTSTGSCQGPSRCAAGAFRGTMVTGTIGGAAAGGLAGAAIGAVPGFVDQFAACMDADATN